MQVSPLRHSARALYAALLLGLPALGLPALGWGANASAMDSAMSTALNAAREQRWDRVDEQAIQGHVLSGYVDYHRLRGQLPQLSPETVNQFIATHADSPLADWLRGQAISQYGRAGRYQDLLAVADGEPAGSARQCYYYTALYPSQPQVAREAGLALWKVGSSQPDACDTLFDRLRADGTLDETAIWERKMLAWQAGETRLMDYLDNSLSGQWQTANDTVAQVDRDSRAVASAPPCLGPECAATAAFYVAAMQRFTREDTAEAFSVWQAIGEHLTLPTATRRAIEEELAFYALVRDVPGTQSWVDSVLPSLDSERVLELRVRRALAERNWADVIHWIAEMAPEQQQNSRWEYWLARANEQLGNQEAATARYRQAAQDRSFYGFAAAERLGQPLQLNLERNHFDEASRERIARLPVVQRTEALLRIGEDGLANSEWLNAASHFSPYEVRELADYAEHRGWYPRLVQTTIAAGLWDALDWRFPAAYRDSFVNWGNATGVDPYLLMAITRRESAYNPEALSPAGARGLMQLMPGTATLVSRQVGISDPGPYGILDPETNIRLGSTYLRDKINRYQGNRLAAAAAYNAGPGRVDQWLASNSVDAFDLFVESIPFRETRDYVQAVLSYRAIFESLDNGGNSQGVALLTPNERQTRYDSASLRR